MDGPPAANLLKLSFDGLTFIQASTEEHFAMTAKLRQDEFGRLLPEAQRADYPWLDALDFSTETVVLLALAEDGTSLGTLRIHDGRHSRADVRSPVANLTLVTACADARLRLRIFG